jgi:hypothetical protein
MWICNPPNQAASEEHVFMQNVERTTDATAAAGVAAAAAAVPHRASRRAFAAAGADCGACAAPRAAVGKWLVAVAVPAGTGCG